MAFVPRLIEKFLDMINLQKHNDNYADIKTELDKSDDHIANSSVHTTQIEKDKLAGIEAGAEVNDVRTVAGRTGNVTIGWSDVGSRPTSSTASIDDSVNKRHEHPNKEILDDTTASFTSEDKDKLDGIDEGAQINQDAFARIAVSGQGDVFANVTSALLTLIADVGITITTDPVNRTITFTATGDMAPAAHGSTHLPGGADPIPYATTSVGGLLTPTDKAKLNDLIPSPPWTWADLEG